MDFIGKIEICDNYKAINTSKIAIGEKKRNINTNDVMEYMNAVADIDIHLIDHSNNKSHKRSDSGVQISANGTVNQVISSAAVHSPGIVLQK